MTERPRTIVSIPSFHHLVQHRCGAAIELRRSELQPSVTVDGADEEVMRPWCPACKRFVLLADLDCAGPFSAVLEACE